MRFIVQGYPVYCTTGGKPFDPTASAASAPTVVFVHGAGMDAGAWQWQARSLAHHGYRVLVPDLPAHGRSPGLPRDSVAGLADWLIALMNAAQIERAALVGHSLGSLVALQAAIAAPARVSHLALVGCAAPMPVGAPFLAETKAKTAAGVDMQTLWGHAPAVRLAASPTPGLYLPNATRVVVAGADPGVQHAGLSACNTYVAEAAAIASIACPTAVLVGTRDMMTPAKAGRALAAQIAGAKVTAINAGHSMMSERPREVTRALMELLG
jgi:pimeloyl-ACP methyl ester carboxylesterase